MNTTDTNFKDTTTAKDNLDSYMNTEMKNYHDEMKQSIGTINALKQDFGEIRIQEVLTPEDCEEYIDYYENKIKMLSKKLLKTRRILSRKITYSNRRRKFR